MWSYRTQPPAHGRGLRFTIEIGSAPLPYAQVLHYWRHDAEFRAFFIRLLADAPFTAFRWETPPITNPVWLSTAGAGVSWLHVRLDDRPKYYGHGPYRTAPIN